MPFYICNKLADDKSRHEVHENTCSHLPLKINQIDIGFKNNCQEAIRQMYEWNPSGYKFDGCWYCCRPCNHG